MTKVWHIWYSIISNFLYLLYLNGLKNQNLSKEHLRKYYVCTMYIIFIYNYISD